MKKKGKVVDPRYARTKEYRKVLEEIAAGERCPFCPDAFMWHQRPILRRSGRWFITANRFSYKEARVRLMIIGTEHRESFEELTRDDLAAVRKLARWAIARFKIRGGALAIRFGDSRFTGATVVHLHFHLIGPKLDRRRRSAKKVNFPIG